MEYPPRFGDWSAVNRHLTAGGTVEGIPRENPYREYYLSLHKKNMEAPTSSTTCHCEHPSFGSSYTCINCGKPENPCGKPHNNGRDTCAECLTIKEGI